ncbi:hypothetical protein IC582_007208 [Cucumis melo]|uniref:Histone acetyltransferase n=2 Tax=Cucumis melo TaxID=3656 RepID=A0A5D3E5M9_CUCMM|nr:uncharacterized protein E5676_scaffold455G007480 [Cucumis melo var. makuwa]
MPPRTGCRPFECVRRAWHSERHQPIRGSLIQEIFRVVSEVHCCATKKNKEWQEKLPIVVLKAEEILYSKADSEAEYMDVTTLWTRINEAINTIIRLDKDAETGEFLHPCIEAALYLGCTPRRSSKSNRGSKLRGYLNSCTPQILDTSPNFTNTTRPTVLSSQHLSHCPNLSKQTRYVPKSRMENQKHVGVPSINPTSTVYKNICASIGNQQFLTETVAGWDMFSLCPLYQGRNQHVRDIEIQPNTVNNNPSFFGPSPFKYFHSNDVIPARNNRVDLVNSTILHKQQKTTCDLSLRLGSLFVPHSSIDNNQSNTINNIDASQKQITSSSDRSFQLDKTFPFFPLHGTYDALDFH